MTGYSTGPVQFSPTAKEFKMPPETEKGAPSPGELKLTAEQERLIALGKAFIAAMQAHVKSRYGPCGQEKTGEVIAATFDVASEEQIKAAVSAADEVFNERFPGKGDGVQASETTPAPVKRSFNPFRSAIGGGF
jgi:hypothetical protein